MKRHLIRPRLLLPLAAVAGIAAGTVLVAGARSTAFQTYVVSETSNTITLGWAARSAEGFEFYRDGELVASTADGTRTSVRFWKGAFYRILETQPGEDARYPGVTPPPPPPTTTTPVPPPPTTTVPVPPPPTGNVVQVSGTLTSAQVNAAAGSGTTPITVRGPFTVNGNVSITRTNLRVDLATVNGELWVGASGVSFTNGAAQALSVTGASNVTVSGSMFDNGGRVPTVQSIIDRATNLKVTGNTFKNFYGVDSSTHSEALFWGAGSSGLIEGNTFTNNGTTGHIFFTWWPTYGNWPHDVCVKGNTFGPRHGAYNSIDFRNEIPLSSGIRVDPNQPSPVALTTSPQFNGPC